MKETLITILRNRHSTIDEFREATELLGSILAYESGALLSKTTISVETPISTTHGTVIKHQPLLIPILRAGLALLNPFMRCYKKATVGFIGIQRIDQGDKTTSNLEAYYENIPTFNPETPILLLDPMMATGGSSILAVNYLKSRGANENQINLISFLASPEGVKAFQMVCPEVNLLIAKVDEGLDANKWIVPGLGDFGDRYFGG